MSKQRVPNATAVEELATDLTQIIDLTDVCEDAARPRSIDDHLGAIRFAQEAVIVAARIGKVAHDGPEVVDRPDNRVQR